jgi:DNA-binding SARP family transcriptional activator
MLALRGANGRSRLAGSLWPDVAQARAMASLRTAIWRVNQAVPSLILSSAGNLVLDRATDVDVDRLVAVSRTLLTAAATPTQFETLGAEGGGDLLPDWDEDWLDGDRERLRQLRLHVLEAHAERLLEAGAFGLALERALAALCCDPLRESAHRAVIRIHIAEGNFAEARHAYSRCRHILARELAVSPSGQTVSLVRDLRTDAPHDASPGHREGVADTRGALASGRPS